MRWIYDLEVFPNLFLLCGKHTTTKKLVSYAVSPYHDDREELLKWLKEEVEELVGFNNIYYDHPILHNCILNLWHLRGRDFCRKTYLLSSDLIKGKKRYIKESNYIKKQIDLFKINHYDNKARMTSLKIIEFNLRLKKIEELPFKPGKFLSIKEINTVIDYCNNDIDATSVLYEETLPEIILREKLTKKYKIDFTNYNSTKIGESILINKIIDKLGEDMVYYYDPTPYGLKKKIINTKRELIDLNKIIFDYISFNTEPFQKILKWFKKRTITETKSIFSKIDFEELKILEPHYMIKSVTGKQKTLNVIYKGFQYNFGLGGIHGCIEPGIYKETETHEIWDIDVVSYYPNIAIQNKFYPEHFGEQFCNIYENIYKERQKYNKKQYPIENSALKLVLNGSYGKSNSKYSALYDPAYTMKTTINGQLLLCMLSEKLIESILDCKMLMINTDGITIRFNKKYTEKIKEKTKEWETLTNLKLEKKSYSKLIIKDVNNYIAVGDEIKRKGASFIYKKGTGELELHKNFSMLVVPKAVEAYFVNGTSVEKFLKNHDDIYDFFKRTKINKKDKLYSISYDFYGNITKKEELQRVNRYYISGKQKELNLNGRTLELENKEELINKHGKRKIYPTTGTGISLVKRMSPLKNKVEYRYFNLEVSYLCTCCNNMSKTSIKEIRRKLYYPYYIAEAYKIINLIENKQL